ncbi:M23 family metallopeptidase [Candidatus Woesearchaeota archaeon]|nr:M23 family metallopeptidase [Candidatus Woesearchaeota archaeon]
MVKYSYPFPNNINYKMHTGEHHEKFLETKFAIDFILPMKTKVLAARAGKVVSLKKDSNKYISNMKIINAMTQEAIKHFVEKYTNFVCITHSDGTFAEYLHLDRNVQVKEGQKVKAGEIMGYIGMTGLTTQSHLHFNVFKIKNGKGISIPIEFK